ncbi:MAG: glutamate-5-semialdehyde dehydrogenase [Planctomycetaceae bacterium]|jgi:glutamate-5-semialdehyde dehydrogenase|nr:glutamate-5-semialdehyde dehydrogenase [Planctomycetaceae bacterium]MDC0307596.1 glutamate-5-semialdehyde dehydrogenase [Planctomycetaceae bacterium]MDG2388497.1 glutamate-5-semialdehyde dehydrogenase [Planctomycetaceae bacterium]
MSTAIEVPQDLAQYTRETAQRAKDASRQLGAVSGAIKNQWLRTAATRIREQTTALLEANQQDIAAAPQFGLTDAQVDRLRLSPERLDGIANALEELVMLADPIGEVLESIRRPNGLQVSKVRVPLGVVFFIYESRPNVTVDAAAICVKSGNAVILRGGKEAFHSNHAFHKILSQTLLECGLPEHAVQMVTTTDRAAVGHFLELSELIDVTIPRGGKSLIERVASEAKMPVIKHFDGNCHVYVDASADLEMAVDIIVNSKCQRTGVCNAAESLLVHADIAQEFLPKAAKALLAEGVQLRCCERSLPLIPEGIAATEADYLDEFLDLILAVKVVDSVEEAVTHINHYGSHHTDAIVTRMIEPAETFLNGVDSSAVVQNASTRFNDGGELGLGAEIGISTDKFHARGPCGLRELTSYKYVIQGQGQIRS